MILKIFYQKILLLSLVVLTLAIHSCNKESECEGSQSAKLINMTGLDGCSWMIKLGDGTKLEPTNLNDFNINCLLYTSPSPRDLSTSRMPSSA